MEYEIKMTGSGTAEEIAKALYNLAKDISSSVGSDNEANEIEGTYEDYTLCTEITSI